MEVQDYAKNYQFPNDKFSQHAENDEYNIAKNESQTLLGTETFSSVQRASRSQSIATEGCHRENLRRPNRVKQQNMRREPSNERQQHVHKLCREAMAPEYRGYIRSLDEMREIEGIMNELFSAPLNKCTKHETDHTLPEPSSLEHMRPFVKQIHDAIMDWSNYNEWSEGTWLEQQEKVLTKYHQLTNLSVECIS